MDFVFDKDAIFFPQILPNAAHFYACHFSDCGRKTSSLFGGQAKRIKVCSHGCQEREREMKRRRERRRVIKWQAIDT